MLNRTRTMLNFALAAAVVLPMAGCIDDPVMAPPPPVLSDVIHYWHFNNLPAGTLTSANADFSKLTGAVITFPGTGAGYMDYVDPGSLLGAQQNAAAGYGIRFRNPSNTREAIIVAPSTGYQKLTVSFAVMKSSTASGADNEEFYYSTNGGTTWTMVGAAYVPEIDYTLKTIDLSAVAAVNDNANLRFRILFTGPLAAGTSGNHRVDNFAVIGFKK
jgi:hypothetical protein